MSRQQFIAELTQYLTFVTPREKEYIVSALSARFDEAGPQGEASLLMELGTPMSIAIALKRRKESGESICPDAPQETPAPQQAAPVPDAPVPEAPLEESPQAEAPEETPVPREPVIDVPAVEPPPPPSAEETLVKELLAEGEVVIEEVIVEEIRAEDPGADRLSTEPTPDAPETEDEMIPAISSSGAAHVLEPVAPPPAKKLSPAGAVGASLLSILIALVTLAMAAVGGYCAYAGFTIIMAGLSTMSVITDALWLFAVGFGLTALGMLILWFAIWAAISLIHRLFKGKALAGSGFKAGMKKGWKTVWIIFIVLLVIGIGCGAVSYFTGGYIDLAFANEAAVSAVDRLLALPLSLLSLILGIA